MVCMSDIDSYSITNANAKAKKVQKRDAVELAAQFKNEMILNKPTLSTMRREIQMNSLKIRPFAGDVFHLNLANSAFIEALWGVLKVEEYVHAYERQVARKELDVFYRLMNTFYHSYQEKLNQIDMRLPHIKSKGVQEPISLEIFRDFSALRPNRKRAH